MCLGSWVAPPCSALLIHATTKSRTKTLFQNFLTRFDCRYRFCFNSGRLQNAVCVTALEQHLEPLAYHLEVREYLKSRERELWNWFASARAKEDYVENLRLELLKSTYRLDPEGHPELYAGVNEAKQKLQLDIPVTLYQAQNSPQLNACLFFMP